MNYWIDLFTWKTWQEFLEAGGQVSGFRDKRWPTVRKMASGDMFLCYLTGLSRFVAILEVTGTPYIDTMPIWSETVFPCRVPVRVVLALEPQYAVPVKELSSNLSYFNNQKSPHSWSGHFRGSPTKEEKRDAEVIINALYEAHANPIYRDYDRKALERRVPLFETDDAGFVTVPDNSEAMPPKQIGHEDSTVSHEEIQWLLLKLGSDLGLNVWVARNDRNKSYRTNNFRDLPNLIHELPIQFSDAVNKTIEYIDVIWLNDNGIEAAFEVEHTTQIYSGLLRMSDLVSMQPNIDIPLYIVAPDERRSKVIDEINRPTFTKLKKPLREICQYIPYSALKSKLDQIGDLIRYMKPEFLDEVAESINADSL